MIDRSRGELPSPSSDPLGWFNQWLGVLADYAGVGFIILFAALIVLCP